MSVPPLMSRGVVPEVPPVVMEPHVQVRRGDADPSSVVRILPTPEVPVPAAHTSFGREVPKSDTSRPKLVLSGLGGGGSGGEELQGDERADERGDGGDEGCGAEAVHERLAHRIEHLRLGCRW